MKDKALEELQKQLDKDTHERNNRPIPECEGYSPHELNFILYRPFDEQCPVQLKKMPKEYYKKIPILSQVKYLMNLLHEQGELKLTKLGALPVKVVKALYEQRFILDWIVEEGWQKMYKEADSIVTAIPRPLMEISGLAKKCHNKLSLTKTGINLLNNNHELLLLLWKTFALKINWGYFDGYGDLKAGQFGFSFTVILLAKYGQTIRPVSFYADRFMNAFPLLAQEIETPPYGTKQDHVSRCYSHRSFAIFFNFFGLIKLEGESSVGSTNLVSKTELFDEMILCRPHRRMDRSL
jgi:hypothetical protein